MRQVDLGWTRIFVEVVRMGSLSEAARLLNLTQPAVSYQIRRAEAEFGTPLLHRRHRGVEPTEAGARLYDILSRSVAQVDALALRLRRPAEPTVLRLFTDYAFSGLWLIPHLHGFRSAHPELELQIVATQQTDLSRLRAGDTAVVFGDRASLDAQAELLLPETVAPVCAPVCAPNQWAEGLAGARLIHLDSPGGTPWFDWPAYLQCSGGAEARPARGDLRLNTYSLVIEAALAGQGVALGWLGLVDPLLQRGALVEIGPRITAPDRGYFIVQSPDRPASAETLRMWLLSAFTGPAGRRD